MSETDKRRNLHIVDEARDIPESVLDRIIAQTVQQVQAQANRPSPFDLKTFEEIEAFAERAIRASDFIPKDYRGKPDNIILAIMKGKELGLPPMASLESIALVNGRASLWGEAIPGLCMATGLVKDVEERFEGEAGSDDFTAVCVVTRRGMSPRTGTFSYGDVRRAGLKNVHMQYPKDMIMWRARHRAWHGAFPDVLRGLGTAELDQEEAQRPVWTMPQPGKAWFGEVQGWAGDLLRALADEPDAWKWMHQLIDALPSAPTIADVDAVGAAPMVQQVVGSAPADAKKQIEDAFDAARARLGPRQKPTDAPAQDNAAAQVEASKKLQAEFDRIEREGREKQKAENDRVAALSAQLEKQKAAEAASFDHFLFDAIGELVSDDSYTDPVVWARVYVEQWRKTQQPEAMRDHNADALAEAAASEEAARVLSEVAEAEALSFDPVPLGAGRGGAPGFTQYVKDFNAALAQTKMHTFIDWLAAQQETVSGIASSPIRLAVLKAVAKRAGEIGLPVPQGFGVPPTKTEENAAQIAEDQKTVSDPQTEAHADKDAARCDAMIAEIWKLGTLEELRVYSNAQTTATPYNRWKNERPDLADKLAKNFKGRQDEIRAIAEQKAAE